MNKKEPSNKINLFKVLIIISFIGCLAIALLGLILYRPILDIVEELRPQPEFEMTVGISPHFTELWRKADVWIGWLGERSRDVHAVNEGIFLIWNDEITNTPSPLVTLRRLNLYTGQTEWKVQDEINDQLTHNSRFLYSGLGFKQVNAYDLETGKVVWSTEISSRSFSHMTATEENLFIEANPARTYILDAHTGEVKHSEQSFEGLPFLHIENNVGYWQSLPLYLTAINYETKEPLWEVTFGDPYRATPIFTEEYIFVKTRLGRLYVFR